VARIEVAETATARRFVAGALLAFVALLAPIGLVHAFLDLGSLRPSSDIRVNRLNPAYRAPTTGESVIYWKYRNFLAGDAGAPAEIVLIGDSSCFMSVVPAVLQQVTGRSALNLGVDGSYTLDLDRRVLEDYIARFGAPRLVVLHFSASSTIGLRESRQASTYVLLEQRRADVLRWIVTVMDGVPVFYKAGVNFNGAALLQHLFEWRAGEPAATSAHAVKFPPDAELGRLLADTKGFLRNPHASMEIEASSFEPRLSRLNAERLRALFQIAETHGFKLLFVINPMAEAFHNPATVAGFAAFETEIRALARPYRNVDIPTPFLRFYPTEIAYDSAHMLGDGPERNSAEIGAWIKDALGDSERK
jgi:hypothetical protein